MRIETNLGMLVHVKMVSTTVAPAKCVWLALQNVSLAQPNLHAQIAILSTTIGI